MNVSEPFVRRPVATTLLTIGIALAGLLAYRLLPVAPLPQVELPTISVSASLPGASPEVMATTVATPLERALGRIAGVTEITSSSSLGSTRVTLQFELSRDIDAVAREVQAAINAARESLPTSLPNNPTYRKVNPADAPIMILALTSDTYTQGQMYDFASTVLAQRLSQVPGVGQATVGGSSPPAVRVELNPYALQKHAISLEEVRAAINAANSNRPKGLVEDGERAWQIYANDQAGSAAEYLPIIVRYSPNGQGGVVRLSDVATVVDSVQDLRHAGSANGRPSVAVVIYRQPGANIIDTVERIQALLPVLRGAVPAAIDVDVVMERTSTIRASIAEVQRALGIAIALVVLVVLLFLRRLRTALIPALTVPVSLVGTFTVMYLLGYSVNNLSLMALTVATGFLVDDAVVVLENVSRHIERGMPPLEAALQGTREVGFTVLSMSLSLIAVFIPILLMGGIVGRYFREFSVTLSVAILVSLVVSLTATPMMCARLLKSREEQEPGRVDAFLESVFQKVLSGYRASLAWALRHAFLVLLILAGTIALNVHLYTIVPKGFFPTQDTGRLFGSIRGDQGISFQAMREKLASFVDIVRADPAVETVTAFTGGGQRNRGVMFVALKPLEERRISAEAVVARLRGRLASEPGANLFLTPVQDFRIGGRQSDATYQFTLLADELGELREWGPRLERALRDVPEIADVNSDQEVRGLQMMLTIDRRTAARLGISTRQIDTALNLAFGQAVVSTIYGERNQYRVVMEVAPPYWQGPQALDTLWLVSPAQGLVPLSAVASWNTASAPLSVNHQSQFAASTMSFNLAPGVSLSQATAAVQDTMARIGMPATIHGGFQGTARVFRQSLESQPWLILAALLAVYIVLGILYESLVHPVTILSTLPSAGVGALLALMLFGRDFSIIAFIGVILLIGIVKKNAIMMVDVALQLEREAAARGERRSPEDAIMEACLLRFRPIMMTTIAAIAGAVPLAIGFGYGAELRQPLGIAVIGGLALSQLLTLYTTPVIYLCLDRLRLRFA